MYKNFRNVRSLSLWPKTMYLHLTQGSNIKDRLIFWARKKTCILNGHAVSFLRGTNKHFEHYSLQIVLKRFMVIQI